jgi:transcriptional regulator with XRE-family HTH domain
MSFKIRLEKILKQYEINAKKLGESLGYGNNPAKLYRLLNDENNNPSIQIIQDILKAFPMINARWLITGEEEMLLEEGRVQYGFCKECIKKEAIIEELRRQGDAKDKRIEELLLKNAGIDTDQDPTKPIYLIKI